MIKRKIEAKIVEQLSRKEITIVIGARQVGKTTIIRKIIMDIQNHGDKAIFLNLDFESDARFFESQELLLKKDQSRVWRRARIHIHR
jgi:predicted AAA+ superfamily ATPase